MAKGTKRRLTIRNKKGTVLGLAGKAKEKRAKPKKDVYSL